MDMDTLYNPLERGSREYVCAEMGDNVNLVLIFVPMLVHWE